jgi:VWFA-related protein
MSMARVSALLLIVGLVHLSATAPHAAAQQGAPAAAGVSDAEGQQGQQGEPGAGDQPTFRGGIDFVRVDVVVSDGQGTPVLDLEAADFDIREDGESQAIEQFRVIKVDGNLAPEETAPRAIRSSDVEEMEAQRDDVRLFAFFLDDYHVRASHAVAVRQTLVRFIETQLGPNDMLAVMYPLTPVNDVVFTRDHESIMSAIARFEGRKYDYTPRNAFERNYERQSTAVVERIRNSVVIGALEALSLRLGGLRDGRKSVIFVSEGLTVLLPPQMRRNNAQGVQVAPSAGGDPRVEALAELGEQMDLESQMREVYRAANRNNTSFYSLDPRGLAVFEFEITDGGFGGGITPQDDAGMLRSTQETLRELSRETDGRAIINRNTLAEGLAEMVRDASYYYLIGYTSPAPADGKFHEIDVRVKRSGVDVRARRGFWALSAENITQLTAPRAPEIAKPVLQALATLSPAMQAARFVRTWVGTGRGDNGKTLVTLVWEPLPIQQGVRREEAGSVSLLALDADGNPVYRGRSPDDRAGAGGTAGPGTPAAAAGASRAPRQVVFQAPPGRLDMRLSVEAAGGGTLDSETRTIDVPDLAAGTVTLSTPRVYRARTARDFQQFVADAGAVPVAAREFSRTERLLIRFDAYGPGSETPVPSAALLGRNGAKIADVAVSPAKAGGTHQIDLPLNAMAAGEYLIEIALTGATGEAVTELVPFRLGA